MTDPEAFAIEETNSGSAVHVSVRGELDMHTATLLAERIEASLARGGEELRLDLADLVFMDSSGLRLLIDLHHRAQRDGWRLRLIAPRREEAALALRVSGADTALPFETEASES